VGPIARARGEEHDLAARAPGSDPGGVGDGADGVPGLVERRADAVDPARAEPRTAVDDEHADRHAHRRGRGRNRRLVGELGVEPGDVGAELSEQRRRLAAGDDDPLAGQEVRAQHGGVGSQAMAPVCARRERRPADPCVVNPPTASVTCRPV
jgi:hypothetical protein